VPGGEKTMSIGTIEVVVEEVKNESPYVKSFKLRSADGAPLPRSSGGAHISTRVGHGDGLIERHYSLTGDKVEISYPKNHFALSFSAKRHVFIAAGIGITPFISMAADLKKKGKPFELHYAAPSKELCAFHSLLSTDYPDQTRFYFSGDGQKMTTEIMKGYPVGTHVYFCGPEQMVREFQEAAKLYGYPEGSIHFELFSAPDHGPKQAFQVKLSKSNQVLDIAEGENLLDVLLKNNINAPYACKVGGCGTCSVDVLDGEVDHRDVFLTDQEKKDTNVILTCVSRGKSKCLTLDI
jgi:ferredoxin-NADP reductase